MFFEFEDTEEPAVRRRQYDTAIAQCEKSLKLYDDLNDVYEKDSNFRYIDQTPNTRGKAECYYLMGEVHRFKALVEKKGSTARESEQNACITCVNKAIELYQGLIGKRAKRGIANCNKVLGRLKHDKKDLEGCKTHYAKALAIYQENGDTLLETETAKALEDVSVQIDKVAVFKAKIASMKKTGSKEEESVRAAFDKFDADGSGEMDLTELTHLAVELGTFPPLTETEQKEAMLQLDNSKDGLISFDEFWTWWVTDTLLVQGNKS